jgi:hypothetical protein
MLWVKREIRTPFAQHILMEIEVAGSLGDRNTPILYQLHQPQA